jgi:hypothetical protein
MREQTLPLWLLDHAQAKPGYLLVERVEMPARRGAILLPFATREYNRAAEAVVHDSQAVEYEYLPGDVVVLTGTVSRFMHFGEGEARRTLWMASPEHILMKLHALPETMVGVGEDHYQRNITSEQYEAGDIEGVNEGEAWNKTAI